MTPKLPASALEDIGFDTLFDAAPAPCLVLSPQLSILAANAAYLAVAGRDRASIVGLNIFEAFPDNPDDPHADGVASLRASLQRVLATGRPDKMAAMRYDVAPEPGGINFLPRYWRSVNTPVLDDNGAVRCIIQSVEEVTSAFLTRGRGMREVLSNLTDVLRDLKTPEDIGYQAAAILGDALGTSRVGFGTIDTVRDTLHVVRDWCADGVETLAGKTELRHYGHFIDDLKLGKLIVIGDVDHDSRTAHAAAALRGRSAGAFVNVPVVEHGALVAVLFVNNAAARDWSVEELLLIKEVAARIRTAGERLRVTAALRESEARFRIITEAMPQMVWSNRPDGYNDYHNEQWHGFTGAPRNATDGHRWSEMFHPDDRARAWELWQHCLRTGETYEIEYRLRHHSGAYRWVLGRALPLRDDDGRITRWLGTCTDIDNQKRAEETLREANGRKDEFLAMLAHELRNPLAPISSAAQILLLARTDPDSVQRAGEVILRQVRHLTGLVDDLLDVSRVTHGMIGIDRQRLDLRDVLHHAVEQAQPTIDARQHRLVLDLAPGATLVLGDRLRLVQVVVNLLNNAAKYTPPGGAVTLALAAADGQARIEVTDTGCGIEPALLPHVFDLFIQAKRTPDRQQGGLGLGLALVQRIAALHDGSVRAFSDGAGLGSRFVITLPVLSVLPGADTAG
ncbi:UNVERIFIED_ORG: PAS domain S-box-containing protein [Zoogloea ramigera]|uniref:histidine kinase n=1 Tax=Duganella zoogloeoides TaxID=75659 RepID=A0ABZ0XSD1_9BURK|nr:PAS domain-containing protein [Duganella zoogloeoides]WQH02654.1 PAS domain-containing protein [Duganella zoogloeoides]